MPSLIFIGDPHFQVGNIPEVNIFIKKMEELALRKKPDIICIGGDVLHTHERLNTIPLNKAYEFIDRMRKISLTYVLVGNHDAVNNQIFLTENHWMNGMKEWDNVVIVDKVKHKIIDEIHLVFCPYVPPGRFQEALNTNKKNWKKADCIFAHQEFFGCKMGAILSTEGDKWPKKFPYIVSGHIHSKQMPQENIYYTGSSMQHAFGESEQNIIAELSWKEKGKYDLTEHDLELPRKKIVYSTVEDVEDIKISENKGDKIKVSLSGNYEEFKAFRKTRKYKELLKTGTKIVFKPKKIEKKEAATRVQEITETDFEKILYSLVLLEKDAYLLKLYDLILKNKHTNVEDILFL